MTLKTQVKRQVKIWGIFFGLTVLFASLAPLFDSTYWWTVSVGRLTHSFGSIPAQNLYSYMLEADAQIVLTQWQGAWWLYHLEQAFGVEAVMTLRALSAGLSAAILAFVFTGIVTGLPIASSLRGGLVTRQDGQTNDGRLVVSTYVFSCLFQTMQYRVAVMTSTWTLASACFWFGSTILYVSFLLLYSLWPYNQPSWPFLNPNFYFVPCV